MLQSPFTFYRGAALNMAADLQHTPAGNPRASLRRLPLMNFGAFATPERRVIFDINDLDETCPPLGVGRQASGRQFCLGLPGQWLR